MSTNMSLWIIAPFIHSGALWSGILLVGLWTRITFSESKMEKGTFAIILVLAFLTGYSDVSFIAYFVIPVAIATVLLMLCKRKHAGISRVVWLVLVSVFGIVLDLTLRGSPIRQSDTPLIISEAPAVAADPLLVTFLNSVIRNVENWFSVVVPHMTTEPILAAFILATPIMILRALWLIINAIKIRGMSPAVFIEISLAGTQVAAVIVPVVTGLFAGIWSIRYALPIALIPILWLSILFGPWFYRLLHNRLNISGASVGWLAAMALIVPLSPASLQVLTAPPPTLQCMRQLNLTEGFAMYWNAKFPVFMSDYAVHLIQLNLNGTIYPVNTNHRWETTHIKDGRPIAPNFVAMYGLERPAIEQIFGPPSQIKDCLGAEFWIYTETLPVPPWG